jgi:large subunit ribosomal protein L1
MSGKRTQQIRDKAPKTAVDLKTAITFLKENARSSFNETIELHVHLGIDSSKSDQMVRGNVVLPSGTPKQKKVAVFTNDKNIAKAAQAAGAAIVGGDELIDQISTDGKLDADVSIATPDMMSKVATVARILGPQGLMPNPKTGTVTPDPAKAVQELAGGKLSFKMDQQGNIHEAIGKIDWEVDQIIANTHALIDAIRQNRPATAKGELIKRITLSSTMGPGLQVTLS